MDWLGGRNVRIIDVRGFQKYLNKPDRKESAEASFSERQEDTPQTSTKSPLITVNFAEHRFNGMTSSSGSNLDC